MLRQLKFLLRCVIAGLAVCQAMPSLAQAEAARSVELKDSYKTHAGPKLACSHKAAIGKGSVHMVDTGSPKTTVAGNNASVRRGLRAERQSEILELDNLRCLPILGIAAPVNL